MKVSILRKFIERRQQLFMRESRALILIDIVWCQNMSNMHDMTVQLNSWMNGKQKPYTRLISEMSMRRQWPSSYLRNLSYVFRNVRVFSTVNVISAGITRYSVIQTKKRKELTSTMI